MRAFLFDFNATLIHSPTWIALEVRDLPRAAFALLAREGHLPLLTPGQLAQAEATFRLARQQAEETCRETTHEDDLKAMLAALGLEHAVTDQLIVDTVASLHHRCLPSVTLMPHTREMLDQVQALGLRLGIVSNAAYAPFITWTLEQFRIREYFEDLIVSADVGLRKPGLEIFNLTLQRMQLEPAEAAYVGDDYRKDVVAAKNLGLRTIWYRPVEGKGLPVGAVQPDAIVADHQEIPAIAERWIQNGSGGRA